MVLMPAHRREGRSAPFVVARAWCWYLPSHGGRFGAGCRRLGFFRCAVGLAFFFSSLLAISMVSLDIKPEKHTRDLFVNALLFSKNSFRLRLLFRGGFELIYVLFFLPACTMSKKVR